MTTAPLGPAGHTTRGLAQEFILIQNLKYFETLL